MIVVQLRLTYQLVRLQVCGGGRALALARSQLHVHLHTYTPILLSLLDVTRATPLKKKF